MPLAGHPAPHAPLRWRRRAIAVGLAFTCAQLLLFLGVPIVDEDITRTTTWLSSLGLVYCLERFVLRPESCRFSVLASRRRWR